MLYNPYRSVWVNYEFWYSNTFVYNTGFFDFLVMKVLVCTSYLLTNTCLKALLTRLICKNFKVSGFWIIT